MLATKTIPDIDNEKWSSPGLATRGDRHRSVTKENRLCKFCGSDIDYEFQFVLKCRQCKEIRLKYM